MPVLPSDLTTLSDPELDALFDELKVRIAVTRALLEQRAPSGKKIFRVARSTLLNFVGLALAPPTGGLSALLCVIGLSEWVETIVDDADEYNLAIRLNRERRDQDARLSAFGAEYTRRGRLK